MSCILFCIIYSMGNVRSEQGDLFLVSCFVLPWTSGGTDIPPYRMLPSSRNRCKNVCTCENVSSWKKCIQLEKKCVHLDLQIHARLFPWPHPLPLSLCTLVHPWSHPGIDAKMCAVGSADAQEFSSCFH